MLLSSQLANQLAFRDCQAGVLQNVNCKIVEIIKSQDGFQLKIELLAYKEKMLKEVLHLDCSGSAGPLSAIKLILVARVLGTVYNSYK